MKLRKTGKTIIALMLVSLLMPLFAAYASQPAQGYTPSGLPFSVLESRIDALVAQYLGVSTPGVAIVVVSEGEVIFQRGYGYADTQRGISVDPETTVFRHGSINKVFVWLAVMRLVEQGLIDLDADIAAYLPPDFLNQVNFAQAFSMRNLMNHTAGFEDGVLDIMFDLPNVREHRTLEEALLLSQVNQIYTVGTVRGYSNWGAALAAFVVEQVSGVPYYIFEREHILQPLGMYNTLSQPDWLNNQGFLQHVAEGYNPIGGGRFRRGVIPYITLYPAGSTLGTVVDMAYFLKALTPPVDEPAHTFYGFMNLTGVMPTFGHGGGTPVSTTLFAVEPTSRFGFAVFTNVADELPIQMGLHDLLMGNTMDTVPPSPGGLPNATAVEGNFVFSNQFGGFVALANYLNMIRVTAINDNTIELRVGSARATYRQIAPYIFHRISLDGHQLHLSLLWEQLHFHFDNGRITHGSSSGGAFDLVAAARSTAFLLVNAFIAVLAILFFLVAPVVLFIRFFMRRRKSLSYARFEWTANGFLLLGTFLAVNNVVWFLRVFTAMFMVSASSLAFHVWINYVLVGLSGLMLGLVVFFGVKDEGGVKVKSKVFFGGIAMLLASFVFVLQYWNFFSAM